MKRLSRDTVKTVQARFKLIEIPQFDIELRVTSLKASTWLEIKLLTEGANADEPELNRKVETLIMVNSIIDDSGAMEFNTPEGIEELDGMSDLLRSVIVSKILEFNGVADIAGQEKKLPAAS